MPPAVRFPTEIVAHSADLDFNKMPLSKSLFLTATAMAYVQPIGYVANRNIFSPMILIRYKKIYTAIKIIKQWQIGYVCSGISWSWFLLHVCFT